MTGSVQARSKNIVQEVAGFQYQGNAPVITSGTLTSMAATTDSAVGTPVINSKLHGVIVRVTTKVAGDDAGLGLKIGNTEVEGVVLDVAKDTDVGTTLRFFLDSPIDVAAGVTVKVTCDGEPTAGAAALVGIFQPL